jgi:hypothetical protein
VLVPLGAWSAAPDLWLAVAASAWQGLGQGHGRLEARRVEVVVGGRGAAARERRASLWLPAPDGTITLAPAASAAPAPAGEDPRALEPGSPAGPGGPDPSWLADAG